MVADAVWTGTGTSGRRKAAGIDSAGAGAHTGSAAGSDSNADEVLITNRRPSITSVAIAPSGAKASDDLVCSYTGFADPDYPDFPTSGTDASTFAWTVGGSPAGTTSTLAASASRASSTLLRVSSASLDW